MTDDACSQGTMFNPLLSLHRQGDTVELQAYDQIEIVSTFGQPQLEYAALRKGCGLVDLPQRGILELTGKDRLPFLNNLLSNETWSKSTKKGLEPGTGVYALFLNVRGRIVADMNVLERGESTLIEMDARKVELLRATWDRYLFTEQVKMIDRRGSLHEIALHGPASAETLQTLTGEAISLSPMQSKRFDLKGIDVILWRDDVCAVPGYHMIVGREQAVTLWTELAKDAANVAVPGAAIAALEASQADGGRVRRAPRPVGWAAFNAARVEAGRPMLDIDYPGAAADRPGARFDPAAAEETTATPANSGLLPAELGSREFSRAINLSKCYIGQEVVARMHARKQVARMIVGVRMASDALPVAGSKVFDDAANEVGIVTSSSVSPVLSNAAICLAYVKRPFFEIGRKLMIPAEGALREGTVVETPFIQF